MNNLNQTEAQALAFSAEIVNLYRSLIVFQTQMLKYVSAGRDASEIKERAASLQTRLGELAHNLDPVTTSFELYGDCEKGQVWDPALGRCVYPTPE